jgi:ribosome maturation factor RimP
MADVVDHIRQLLDPILASQGLALWDLEFQRQGPKWLLRIYIDRESGVTLNDCESVSRDLSAPWTWGISSLSTKQSCPRLTLSGGF